ncbi:hypothetical protein [Sphingobium scionense]|jgi:hypothetical protein|uniref:hypothetical protein n=1 Tax=Sphingobium scionense TaxID=1404341 RepID=UPI0036D391ED
MVDRHRVMDAILVYVAIDLRARQEKHESYRSAQSSIIGSGKRRPMPSVASGH